MIARRPGIALYLEVQHRIEELARAKRLGPGDALPGEVELQARFGVSRSTVRQALAELERLGVVERRQGRGTFLALPAMERALPELTSFSEHLRARGIRSTGDLIEFGPVFPDAAGDVSHFPPDTPLVRAVRLRYANDVAVGLHTVYVPVRVADLAGFEETRLRADRSVSFYALLEAAGIRIAWAEEHLQARVADATEAAYLGTESGTPVMSVLRLTRDDRDRLVEVVRAVYLGDKYDYVVQLERRGRQEGRQLTVAVGRGVGAVDVEGIGRVDVGEKGVTTWS